MAVTSDGTPYVEPGDAISAYPVVSQELAAVIDSLRTMIPVGAIFPYAGKTAPEGYLFCDGKAYTRTDFYDLYVVMAEWVGEWGGFPNGNSAQFFVPDMRGRAPFGVAGNVPTTDGDPTAPFTLGKRYGDARVPLHTHTFKAEWSAFPLGSGALQNDTGYIAGTNWNGSWSRDGLGTHWPTDQQNPHGVASNLSPNGMGRNVPPGTGVNFIVWTGTTTAGKNPVPGVELPAVTTRMMIEARLEEAGIGEEEIEQLREQLAALKEDIDG